MRCPNCGRECEWNPCEYCSGRKYVPFETQEEKKLNHAFVMGADESRSRGYSQSYVKRLEKRIEELEKIVEHVATDGAEITKELVKAAKKALLKQT